MHTDADTESGVPLHGVVEVRVLVANVRAAQRPGTNLVDIDYDVTGTTLPVHVKLEVSADDGATYAVPVSSVTGAVGRDVAPGTNLRLTWDAGADWAGRATAQARFKVTADDHPIPPGFALIPAGEFLMGDQSDPRVGESDEYPVHSVYVSGFYMAKHEVTKALWDEVATWAAGNGYDISAGGAWAKVANHPAHAVAWYEYVKWCNARSQKEGLVPCYTVDGVVYKTNHRDDVVCNRSANGYRLPTEAEWEKAARGGEVGLNFPWGDTITHSQANYCSRIDYSYDISPTRSFHPTYATGEFPYSSPVGSFAPNGYGLYDMAGNAVEYCWDWYSSSYYSFSPGSDPCGPASGSNRVYRGGSWDNFASAARCARRGYYYPWYEEDWFPWGFRLARSSVP